MVFYSLSMSLVYIQSLYPERERQRDRETERQRERDTPEISSGQPQRFYKHLSPRESRKERRGKADVLNLLFVIMINMHHCSLRLGSQRGKAHLKTIIVAQIAVQSAKVEYGSKTTNINHKDTCTDI